MTIFLSRKQGFLGLSQRFDIKQGSGITGMMLLPTDLKRGVLSEDGVWNLLEEIRAIKERMQDLSK